MCCFDCSSAGGTMALETRAIFRRPGAVAKSVVREHASYPTLYPPTLPTSACLNDNVAQW